MIEAPALPFLGRGWTRPRAAGGANAEVVEVFAPDRASTELLLEYAAQVAQFAPAAETTRAPSDLVSI